MFTQAELQKLLTYDPETGSLTWLTRPCSRWNKQFAGKRAFTTIDHQGYCKSSILGRTVRAHQVIWCLVNGEWPSLIDHINRDRSDNRICNLRVATPSENMRNTSYRAPSLTGVVGVYHAHTKGKWKAQIAANGKDVYLGTFTSKDTAMAVRRGAERLRDALTGSTH